MNARLSHLYLVVFVLQPCGSWVLLDSFLNPDSPSKGRGFVAILCLAGWILGLVCGRSWGRRDPSHLGDRTRGLLSTIGALGGILLTWMVTWNTLSRFFPHVLDSLQERLLIASIPGWFYLYLLARERLLATWRLRGYNLGLGLGLLLGILAGVLTANAVFLAGKFCLLLAPRDLDVFSELALASLLPTAWSVSFGAWLGIPLGRLSSQADHLRSLPVESIQTLPMDRGRVLGLILHRPSRIFFLLGSILPASCVLSWILRNPPFINAGTLSAIAGLLALLVLGVGFAGRPIRNAP